MTCNNPVTEDGDCCPRCEDDPCARQSHNNITSIVTSSGHPQPCSYAGIVHESGSSWQDFHDKCTTCECKVRGHNTRDKNFEKIVMRKSN